MIYKHAGKKLREIRLANNLTQEKLAEIFNVSKNHLSAVERGIKKGSLELYADAVNYFKVSFDYFFMRDFNDSKSMHIDTVMIKMKYMDESKQKFVEKLVQDVLDFGEER